MIHHNGYIIIRVTFPAALYEICNVKKQALGKQKMSKPLTKEDALKKLGQRIKELRIKKGYTNYEYFAYEKNISRAQYGRYERGEDIRFGTLVKIIAAFDMTVEEFFSEGF